MEKAEHLPFQPARDLARRLVAYAAYLREQARNAPPQDRVALLSTACWFERQSSDAGPPGVRG
jgi:hypothetical protein